MHLNWLIHCIFTVISSPIVSALTIADRHHLKEVYLLLSKFFSPNWLPQGNLCQHSCRLTARYTCLAQQQAMFLGGGWKSSPARVDKVTLH